VEEEVLPVGTHAIRNRVAILPVEAIELLQRILPEVRQDRESEPPGARPGRICCFFRPLSQLELLGKEGFCASRL
jgi:hypothetical protein